jgi:hypothetical protein
MHHDSIDISTNYLEIEYKLGRRYKQVLYVGRNVRLSYAPRRDDVCSDRYGKCGV